VNRFLVDKINPDDQSVVLSDPQQLHHCRDVLRIKPDALVGIFDRLGNEYLARVVSVGAKGIAFEIKAKKPLKAPLVEITVACAIPKKAKMGEIIDKLTQLGVVCIIPLETQRVIVKLDKQKKLQRFARWQKIALSAVKQSQRSIITEIKPVMDFKEVLAVAKDFDLKLIPTLEDEGKTLKCIFNQPDRKFRKVIVLIGPEGDFSLPEVNLAKAAGFQAVTLGQEVLRVDTAAIAVSSFIKFNAQS
jgi:16S rRNA (uracil1498-N3)-methyltransferase